MRHLPALVWTAALLGVAAPGCHSVEGTRGLPPFFEIYPTPSTTEWTEGEDRWIEPTEGGETVFRPFGSWEWREPDARRLRLFYPFIDFRWTAAETRYQILPVFRRQNRLKYDGGRDIDTMIFPVFFWGSDPEEGSYFAVFPFGGRLRGLLGQDIIDFVLFPIWASALNDGRTSTHIVWPIYNEVSGAGWSGWRVWPFWGSYEWRAPDGRLRNERWFVLWPFWIRDRDNLLTLPTESLFSFPFYGYRENERSLTQTYLWPLYVHHYDKKHDRSLYGGFFFPYRFTEGQTDLWPFFGIKRTLEDEDELGEGSEGGTGRNATALFARSRLRQFALWPIERYEWASDPRSETERLWILPVWWDFERLDKETLETERRWKLWPIAGYTREDRERALDILSPLWFAREEYERLYGRLFAVFRWRSRPDFAAWEVLYGTLYWESRPTGSWFSVLGGLFEIGRKDNGFHARILYVPWW